MPEAALTRSVWNVDADGYPSNGDVEAQARFLLQYVILAPSSHNSQHWEFGIAGNQVAVGAAASRWLDAADPDKRELYISLSCAIENFCVAAAHFDFDPLVEYHDPSTDGRVATVTLRESGEMTTPRPSELFDALTTRYTSHEPFEEQPLSERMREDLRALVVEDDVSVHLVDDPETKGAISELQATADRLLMEDPAYRRELGHWIGRGALGNSWLMARIGQAVVTHLDIGDREAAKNAALVDSASAFATPFGALSGGAAASLLGR